MEPERVFAMSMATASVISFLFIAFHLVRLCIYKKLRNFPSLLTSTLLVCDVFTIIGAFLRFGLDLDGNTPSVCQAGMVLFYLSSYGSFFCSFALVVTIYSSTSSKIKTRVFSEKRSFSVGLYSAVWVLASFFAAITAGLKFKECQGATNEVWIFYSVWLVITILNFTVLGALFCRLREVTLESRGPSSSSSTSKNNRFLLRIVLGIALIIGVVRIPTFILSIVSPGGSVDGYLHSPNGGVMGFFIFSFVLTVLQPTFVVIVVGYNQGAFSFCRCGVSHSSLEKTSEVTGTKSGNGSSPNLGSSLQIHEGDVQMA